MYISPGFSKKDVEDAISKFDSSKYLIKTVSNKYMIACRGVLLQDLLLILLNLVPEHWATGR